MEKGELGQKTLQKTLQVNWVHLKRTSQVSWILNLSIGKLGSSRKKFMRELGFSFIGELGTSGKNFVVELGPKFLSIIGELGTFILEKTSQVSWVPKLFLQVNQVYLGKTSYVSWVPKHFLQVSWVPKTLFIFELSPTGKKVIGGLGQILILMGGQLYYIGTESTFSYIGIIFLYHLRLQLS